jgi:general secretion pathway protein G
MNLRIYCPMNTVGRNTNATAGNVRKSESGYTLLELIVTLIVLSILIMGTIPLAQNAVKRQREERLRETLGDVRNAIDEFKRDTLGACPQGAVNTGGNQAVGAAVSAAPPDPRSRVVVDDCTIFDSQNLDRYPPTIETLVKGVRVRPRGVNLTSGSGITDNTKQATELNQDKEIIKVYLRETPVDPITGKSDWKFRSSYQDKDSDNWDEINVFDVHSSSDEEGLNGEKYSEW